MRRLSLIARLGPDDKTKVTTLQRDSAVYEIDFLNADRRLDFGMGHALEQLSSLGLNPQEAAVDLVLVAALINAGDTRLSRLANAQDGWTREIDLYTPVSDPAKWGRARSRARTALEVPDRRSVAPLLPSPSRTALINRRADGQASARWP